MRQVHRAGEKLFIDYAGPTIALTGGGTANIFVAATGASGYALRAFPRAITAAPRRATNKTKNYTHPQPTL